MQLSCTLSYIYPYNIHNIIYIVLLTTIIIIIVIIIPLGY
jgi:hypothetical protein